MQQMSIIENMTKYRTKIPFTKQVTGYIVVEVESDNPTKASDLLQEGFGEVIEEVEESCDITHNLNETMYLEEC